jgi:hypothetical protein
MNQLENLHLIDSATATAQIVTQQMIEDEDFENSNKKIALVLAILVTVSGGFAIGQNFLPGRRDTNDIRSISAVSTILGGGIAMVVGIGILLGLLVTCCRDTCRQGAGENAVQLDAVV